MLKRNDGRWRGTINVNCGACNSSEDLKVTLQGAQSATSVEYICPICDAKQVIQVSRLNISDAEVNE